MHTTVVRPNLRYEVAGVANAEDRLRILVERLRPAGRRLGDRLRAVAPLDRGDRPRPEWARFSRGPLPRRARADGADARPGRLRRRSHSGGRGNDGVRHGDRQARRASRLPRELPRLARGLRADGRPRRSRRRAQSRRSCSQARATRSHFGASRCRTSRPSPSCDPCIASCGPRRRSSRSRSQPSLRNGIRVSSSGMLEQAGLVRRGFDEGRSMRVELTSAPDDAGERVEALLDRATLVAEARADRIVAFAETHTCRHAQVAEHFGETFAAPLRSMRRLCPRHAEVRPCPRHRPHSPTTSARRSSRPSPGSTWPLGRRSLVATLRGSLKAPPSARRSLAYRLLAAAPEADVRRWVQLLEVAGALVEKTTPDGFRVLVADPDAPRPRIRSRRAGRRRRGARRAPAPLAARALARRRRAGLRRAARLDAPGAGVRQAADARRARGRSRASAPSSSSATATTCSPSMAS